MASAVNGSRPNEIATANTVQVLGLDPETYVRSELHAEQRVWVEKNCYIDIWIELIHSLGLDPLPICAFTLAVEFEGDQWTFFKPPHTELWDLYGIDVQELNVWRPLLDHARTHLAQGKLVCTEADSFFLPDTQGTDYRSNHVKTTIIVNSVDPGRRKLGYFHNAAYFALDGDDFDSLFRTGAPPDPSFMPLFAELVRIDRRRSLPAPELAARSREALVRHLGRIPQRNPFERFAARFPGDLARLQEEGIAAYHAWAFATIRQIGASYELASLYLRWLERNGEPGVEEAAEAFSAIAINAKALILKGARSVSARRAADFGPLLAGMTASWDRAIDHLLTRHGTLA